MSRNCRIPASVARRCMTPRRKARAARGLRRPREGLDRGLGRDPVGLEIVLAAKKVVIHPCRMRDCRVDRGAVLPGWFIGGRGLVSHGLSINGRPADKASRGKRPWIPRRSAAVSGKTGRAGTRSRSARRTPVLHCVPHCIVLATGDDRGGQHERRDFDTDVAGSSR